MTGTFRGWGPRVVPRGLVRATVVCLLGAGWMSLAAADDCPPLAGPAGFRAVQEAAERRAYDAIEFTVQRDGRPDAQVIAGPKCYQVYRAEEGAVRDATSLHGHYRDRLEQLKADIVFADRYRLHARLTESGRETWLRVLVQDGEVDITVVRKQSLKPTLTRPSGRDYRLLGHMPNYREAAFAKHADEARRFTVPSRSDLRTVEIRGAVHEVKYQAKPGAPLSSDIEIQENYRAALRALGGEVLSANWRTTIARHVDRGRMVWLEVTSQTSEISVTAVEAALPPAQPRIADGALAAALAGEGQAVVASGLGLGRLPAGEERHLARQMLTLLRRDRALALTVVAHTDDLGDRALSLKRSQAQAEAIVAAVLKQGIARGRIDGVGAGPDRPAADNGTVEGRARNRRIEIVRRRAPPPPLPPVRPDQ